MGLTLKEMAFRYAKEENSRSEHRRDELADLGGALKNAIGRAESAREEQRAIQGLACAPGAGPGRVGEATAAFHQRLQDARLQLEKANAEVIRIRQWLHRHHSSLLAGQVVAGAGELRVRDGRLEWISDKSGHYRPDYFLFAPTLELLAGRGVTYPFEIPYVSGDGSRQFFHSLAAFRRAHAVAEQQAAAALAELSSADPASHYSN